MSDPFLGEIRPTSFNFAPKGWALCQGQVLPINQNQALFAVLGTRYGGDGVTNFRLPNLGGRIPVHQGQGISVGDAGGEAAHVLTINEMPPHNHAAQARSSTTTASPAGAGWGTPTQPVYGGTPSVAMSPAAMTPAGGSQPHENQAPYLVLNFIIAVTGVFPSQN